MAVNIRFINASSINSYTSASSSILCQLHSNFNSIERMTSTCFHETSCTTCDKVSEERGLLLAVTVLAHDVNVKIWKRRKKRKISIENGKCKHYLYEIVNLSCVCVLTPQTFRRFCNEYPHVTPLYHHFFFIIIIIIRKEPIKYHLHNSKCGVK